MGDALTELFLGVTAASLVPHALVAAWQLLRRTRTGKAG